MSIAAANTNSWFLPPVRRPDRNGGSPPGLRQAGGFTGLRRAYHFPRDSPCIRATSRVSPWISLARTSVRKTEVPRAPRGVVERPPGGCCPRSKLRTRRKTPSTALGVSGSHRAVPLRSSCGRSRERARICRTSPGFGRPQRRWKRQEAVRPRSRLHSRSSPITSEKQQSFHHCRRGQPCQLAALDLGNMFSDRG